MNKVPLIFSLMEKILDKGGLLYLNDTDHLIKSVKYEDDGYTLPLILLQVAKRDLSKKNGEPITSYNHFSLPQQFVVDGLSADTLWTLVKVDNGFIRTFILTHRK